MAKSRDKIQQIGFWDSEVSNPDHDAICIWAYKNADAIFRSVQPQKFDREWSDSDVKYPNHDNCQGNIDSAKAFIAANPRPNPRIAKMSLEYVLKSYTGYRDSTERLTGYADLVIETRAPIIAPSYTARRGSDDIFSGFELQWSERAPSILVEVKSALPTLGELMRQIQLYRTVFNGDFVVICPDDSYAEILAEQGITFIGYPSGLAQNA